MPLDGLTLSYVCRELALALVGGRVDKVQQPERDELHLVIRNHGENHRLLLCAGAHHARVHLSAQNKANPMEPPMFCMLLRKHLQGGRVTDVRQLGGDRVAEIDVRNPDEMGVPHLYTLCAEIMGRHSNLILRDEAGRVLDAIRHVNGDMSRVRQVLPGLAYAPPPGQGKRDPQAADAAELARALSGTAGRLDSALLGAIAGLSPQSAGEIAYRLTGDETAPLPGPDAMPGFCLRLRALLDAMPGFGPPVLLLNAQDEAVDIFPFAQRRFAAGLQREVPAGISAALDAFFCARDARERASQRTAALARSLKTHIERCEKKLALQQEALDAGAQADAWRVAGELLNANLHRLQKGVAEAVLENFYEDNTPITVALDARYTPAQNAQRYFKRYQKARSAE
ncbi:MAG: NFACT family protein, partial [Oscillospiraceae bacterium]|nr:NFACT family protein [Oscillospiraceae bacterium]